MRVLFTPYCGGSMAHVVRSLALADALKARGHTVSFTASRAKRAFIEGAGHEVFGEGHPDVNLNDENDQGIGYFKTHRADFLAWFQDEIAAAESLRPDVIVNSPTFFGAIAARKTGIPHVTIINGNWHPAYSGVLGIARSGRSLGDRMAQLLLRPLLVRGFDRVYLAEIQGWYEELGLTPLPTTRADLHADLPALIPGIPALEPVSVEAKSVTYVGPLQWNGFEQQAPDPELFRPSKRPRVYLTLGGSVFRRQTYDELIAAFAARDDWDTVVSLGPNVERTELLADLPHFRIRQYVDGLAACEWAEVVVNTASHGTIMQALRYGKPMVLVPRNIDQSTFAAKLAEIGAAVNLNPMKLRGFTKRESYVESANAVSGEAIVEATGKVLRTPRFRAAAVRLQNELAAFPEGSERAADHVERVVAAGP